MTASISAPARWISWWMGLSTIIVIWGELTCHSYEQAVLNDGQMRVIASSDREVCLVETLHGYGSHTSGSGSCVGLIMLTGGSTVPYAEVHLLRQDEADG